VHQDLTECDRYSKSTIRVSSRGEVWIPQVKAT
jgi:hypothetical protein